ncbi:MAG: Shedu anti-phage system protein SduA domain-containing protein [Pseudomonadota bacterium]
MPNFRIETHEDRERQLAEWKGYFPGARFGTLRDITRATYQELRRALEEGREESIQNFLTANPYVIQYAIPHSGHHGVWVFPKQMIKPSAKNGVAGLIPDYLVVSRSSLGFFWHVVELKRFDRQFANRKGDDLSIDGSRGVIQCQKYLSHFNDYIDAIRINIQAPELVQPMGAILLIGDSEAESWQQNELRGNFEKSGSKISIVSYRRLIYSLASDLRLKS